MANYLYSADVSEGVRKKIRIFVILVVLCFIILWTRVWFLQILKGEAFKGQSENNRVRMVSLPAYRGKILDRNGETLVSIRPSFNLYITPEDTQDLDNTLTYLSSQVTLEKDVLMKEIERAAPFQNILVKRDLPWKQIAFVEENNRLLPGVHLKVEPLRDYVHKDLAAHVLGYLGEVTRSGLEGKGKEDYSPGDLIGKKGMELLFEDQLRGQKGYKEVEVDVAGRELETLRMLPPQSGNNLTLTLDIRLQRLAESLMTGTEEEPKRGSVVLMKVQTGEVLAMVSQPSFDPNRFASGISRSDWRGLSLNKNHPLQNRAIDGQYPPGSTFKVVTALAGLEENIVTPETRIYCPGSFRLGRGFYRCWKRGGHGHVDLHDALVQSCDVYFYTVGHRLGIDTLAKYARKMGLGSLTGIFLTGEKPGLVPTSQWKLNARKEPWQPGETISVSIGQGFNLTTPIQQARLIGTVANGGMVLRPYLIQKVTDNQGRTLKENLPQILYRIDANKNYFEKIREGLLGVVNEPRGTGRRARLKNIQVAGKTGTAQVVRMKTYESEGEKGEIPYEFRDHAWFFAFAPYEEPEVAVAVIVEHGGHGGAAAAPIAKELFSEYFKHYPRPTVEQNVTSMAINQNVQNNIQE
ncbi:MAG: penicillin-binding protein 2 [Candidatus Nitronauta litoralis]|uniref:Beta-lactamase n=1 Tax=Candidatus Nitronauta litoralis TaxID=2705533 RepID=A0A7T0BT73_9BACT|nr:MAG: penicillin-binding protein 2 [Candidatus Nitronauta litoralis]